MGVQNGSLKSPKAMNGINSHAVRPRRKQKASARARPGWLAWSINISARLSIWYSILTILFRCPSSLEDCGEASPKICKPYFHVKHAVSPHIEPYYEAYAAPYVEIARPYYDTVDQAVITPSWNYAVKYGAPRVSQAQAYAQNQWDKKVQPELLAYQALAKKKYNKDLAPHVNHAFAVVEPVYNRLRQNMQQTYVHLLLPSYQLAQPYAHRGYTAASVFTTERAMPTAIWAWNKTYVFLDDKVWPQLRLLYSEAVEPQLVKIGARLGRFNGKDPAQKLEDRAPEKSSAAPRSNVISSFTKPLRSSSAAVTSSTTTSITSTTSVASSSVKVEVPVPKDAIPNQDPSELEAEGDKDDEIRRVARDTVAADLKDWQERYAKAADEAGAEIEQLVEDITKRMIRENVEGTGKAGLASLTSVISSETTHLRDEIVKIIASVASEEESIEKAQDQINQAVRKAGLTIKEKTQGVRAWREDYETQLHAAITRAAESHFSILNSIRELALQKLGMKWAWMDGITYSDWAKYHVLKDRFEDWQHDLEKLIITHPGLEAAQVAGISVEDDAMSQAQDAAKELARLKSVAGWKLTARDVSDNFDSETTKALADAALLAEQEAAREAVEAAREAAETTASDDAAPTSNAFEVIASLDANEIDSATSAADEPPSSKDAQSSLTESVELSTSSFTVSRETGAASDDVDASVNEVKEDADDAAPPKSKQSAKAAGANDESNTSTATDASHPDLVSSVILEETPVFVGNTSEVDQDKPMPAELPTNDEEEEEVNAGLAKESLSSDTASVKPALFGAAAQSVSSRQPILDDDEDDDKAMFESATSIIGSIGTGLPQAFSSIAQSAYINAISQAQEQYSAALSVMSAQATGTPKPARERMFASMTSAYSNAMESASSRFDEAVKAVHDGVYGTPSSTGYNILPTSVPTMSLPNVDFEGIKSLAAERLQQGRAWAEEEYESAKIAIGLATPTPSTPSQHVEKLLENARHNYYAGLGVAHARYSEFLAGASSVFSSLTATATPTPTDLAGTASSYASVASASIADAASAASENAAHIASAASENAAHIASVVGENASSIAADAGASAASVASVMSENVSAGYDAVSSAAAHGGEVVAENWDYMLSQLSINVYGAPTPTPWYESIFNQASDYAVAATAAVDDGASAASAAAAKQYAAVSDLVSELLVGKEPTFSESIYSRLSAAYITGAASVSTFASAAQATAASAADQVASAMSQATEAVKDKVEHVRDEL